MVGEVRRGSHVAAEALSNRSSLSIPSQPSSSRPSMDEYNEREGISEPAEPPPTYDALLESPTLRRRFNIQPREDEGREVLPPYSCEISVVSVFARKMELEGAVHKAQDRNWYKVLATLQGTALSFYKYQRAGIFSSSKDQNDRQTGPDLPAGLKRGEFLRSYNLQHADVGIAADYVKKKFVIRVRAEADQFLLSCNKIETFVLWLQSLFAAIDLAPPLDDREIPRDLSIPRRTRRRINRTAHNAVPSNSALVREQEEIIAAQFPGLAGTTENGSPEPTDQEDTIEEIGSALSSPGISRPVSLRSYTTPTASNTPARTSRSHGHHATRSTSSTTLLNRARTSMQSSSFSPSASTSAQTRNPNITSDGKWRPQHQWTHFYDMMYAKRCMAVLTQRSPRKSNVVIMKGKRWIVDWATGKLERYEPPDYGEVLIASGYGKAGEGPVVVQRELIIEMLREFEN